MPEFYVAGWTLIACPTCKGDGYVEGTAQPGLCTRCGGGGSIVVAARDGSGLDQALRERDNAKDAADLTRALEKLREAVHALRLSVVALERIHRNKVGKGKAPPSKRGKT